MAVNVTKYTAAGADIVYYGARDGSGYLIGGTATAPAAGNADGNPMLKLEGVKNFPHTITEPETVNVTGDDGVLSQFQFQPIELPAFEIQFGTRDLAFEALCQSTLIQAVGDSSIGVVQPYQPTYQDVMFIVQSKADSRAAGSVGSSMWDILVVPNCEVVPLSRDAYNERAAGTIRYRVTTNYTDTFPWGIAVTDAANGTTQGGAFTITAENRIHLHRFTGNGTQAAFNLDYTPAEESSDKVHVYVDGVIKVYTTDYTVVAATKVLTFATGSVPANNSKVEIWFEYTG